MVHGYLSIGILLISIFSLYMSFLFLKKVSGIIKIPFISTFFWFKYIIFAYIGSVILNVFYIDYYKELGLYNRPDLLLVMWYYTTTGLFLIPFGMFIANLALNYNPYKYTKKILSKNIYISKLDKSNITYFVIWALFLLSILVLLLYFTKIPKLPISAVLDGLSPTKLAYLRSAVTNNFIGKYYRYAMFMKDLPLFLLILVFFMKNISLKWKILFYILFVYNIFVHIMDLQKAPVIQLLLLLMLAYFYSKNQISKKIFIVIGIISVILLIIMYVFFMGMKDRNLFEILWSPLRRIFVGQISDFYYYLLYQEQYGYIYGHSFPNPGGIFPFHYIQITKVIKSFANPELIKLGIVGSSPTVFFADWFINFGALMALFSMILLGFILQLFDILFITKLSSFKSVLLSAMFIFMINYFGRFAATSYIGIIFDTTWIFPFMIMVLIIILRQAILIFLRRISGKSSIGSSKQFQK